MTHKEVWEEIAEAFGTPVKKRTIKQLNITTHGLCFAFSKIAADGRLGDRWFCKDFLSNMHSTKKDGYWWITRGDGAIKEVVEKADFERSVFASFMATLSKNEVEEICGKYSNSRYFDGYKMRSLCL